jgi:WS/DGAT/MGAT family acyltransferase
LVARLRVAVERLLRRPLVRCRPLWEMWLLPGLAEGRVGCYLRVHHAIADGMSGVVLLGALLDDAAAPSPVDVAPFTPAPVPSARELLADNLRRRWRGLRRGLAALIRPAVTARRVLAGWPAVHETLATSHAPRTSLNVPIGPGRVFALVRGRIDDVRLAGHNHEATINDVLLAAVAGGLRELLLARGERVGGVVLRAYVPVSLHREVGGVARGNLTAVMAASLPIGVADPAVRLRLIAAETAARRRRPRPPAGALLRNGLIQRTLLPVMARQRFANMYVANVVGPRGPLSLAGSPVRELFPIVPLLGNVTLGVGALSYGGQFNITAVGDRDACGDVAVFADGVRAALTSLTSEGAVHVDACTVPRMDRWTTGSAEDIADPPGHRFYRRGHRW